MHVGSYADNVYSYKEHASSYTLYVCGYTVQDIENKTEKLKKKYVENIESTSLTSKSP